MKIILKTEFLIDQSLLTKRNKHFQQLTLPYCREEKKERFFFYFLIIHSLFKLKIKLNKRFNGKKYVKCISFVIMILSRLKWPFKVFITELKWHLNLVYHYQNRSVKCFHQ